MNKKIITSSGVFAGIITIFFLGKLFQGLILSSLFGKEVAFTLEWFCLDVNFFLGEALSSLQYIIIYFSPFIFYLFLIEISFFGIKAREGVGLRNFFIVFQTFLIGYLILYTFWGTIIALFKIQNESSWNRFFAYVNVSSEQRLLIMFFVIILLFAYLTYASNKIRKQMG